MEPNKQSEFIDLFMKFIHNEKTKIDIEKWNKGIEIKRDPGQEYIIEWINKNAKWFRESWEISQCKTCKHCLWCGYKVEKECNGYTKEE
jgi:hypothetical protein